MRTTREALRAQFCFCQGGTTATDCRVVRLNADSFIRILPVMRLVTLLQEEVFSGFRTHRRLYRVSLIGGVSKVYRRRLLSTIISIIVCSRGAGRRTDVVSGVFRGPLISFDPGQCSVNVHVVDQSS